METKTHWKKLHNPDYIGAYSLMTSDQPIDLIVKIKSIAREQVTGADGKKDDCIVAQLINQKPFIVNATNAKMLTKLMGSPFIEDWINRPFTLYVAQVKVAGDVVDALRIRPQLPQATLPVLNESHPKWAAAIKALQAGNTTIEAIKKSYSVSEEVESVLSLHKPVLEHEEI